MALLQAGQILAHPFVIGEIALGNLNQRRAVLGALAKLSQATVARTTRSFTSSIGMVLPEPAWATSTHTCLRQHNSWLALPC